MRVLEKMRALVRNEQGLSTVEYVVLLVLVVGLSVGTWKSFGDDLAGKLETAAEKFNKKVR